MHFEWCEFYNEVNASYVNMDYSFTLGSHWIEWVLDTLHLPSSCKSLQCTTAMCKVLTL